MFQFFLVLLINLEMVRMFSMYVNGSPQHVAVAVFRGSSVRGSYVLISLTASVMFDPSEIIHVSECWLLIVALCKSCIRALCERVIASTMVTF